MARPFIAALLPLLALALLGGCARPVGDFGRAERGYLHDELMPQMGNASKGSSSFNLADQEIEMRDRVWRYLVAPHSYDWFGDIAVEFQRTRIVPMSKKPLKTDKYYAWLHSERFASSRVRYSRIAEDAIADIGMMPTAFASICEVIELDRQRDVASSEIAGLEDNVRIDSVARKNENWAVIDWFVRSIANRYASYSYALDHLLVETPHEEAVSANATLSDLAIYVESAERGDFCSDPGSRHRPKASGVSSRYLHSAPDEGRYRK